MITRLWCFSYILLVSSLHIVLVPAVGAVINIMPLGDSITQGVTSGVADEAFQVSYRKALYDKLKTAGYVVNDEIFVGTLFSGESVADFDPDHEGHSGWRADQIVAGRIGSGEGKLSDWLMAEEPDIVLLHIGTNDVSGANENWNEVEDILVVIDDYEFTSGKAVWVILSLIIDRGCYPFQPPCPKSLETTEFNNDVRDFVFFPRQTGGDKIVLVDMQNGAGINYDRWYMGGDMWDNVHPFETGYAKMADLWYYAIQQVLNPPVSLLFTPVTPCRIVDTRNAGGAIPPGGLRSYNVRGAVVSQGGISAGCPSPQGEPRAVHLSVTAVPVAGAGHLRMFPFNTPTPNASVLSYKTGSNVANTVSVKTCYLCGKDVNVQSFGGTTHVVIDVMGYYYPAP